MSVKVCCYYCDREIEPKNSGGSSDSNILTSNTFVNAGATVNSASRSSYVNNNNNSNNANNNHTSTKGNNKKSHNKSHNKSGNNSGNNNSSSNLLVDTAVGIAETAVMNSSSSSANLLWCQDCAEWAQRCVVCEMAVRGAVSVCGKCGHGGHLTHLQNWFARSRVCAAGCGCKCTAMDGEDDDDDDEDDDGNDDGLDASGSLLDLRQFSNSSDSSSLDGNYSSSSNKIMTVSLSSNKKVVSSTAVTAATLTGSVITGSDERDNMDAQAMIDNYFAPKTPKYLQEIYNHSSDYNYNNFFSKWGDYPFDE